MKVLKFGGTSVGSVKYINNVISILKSNAIDKSVVVVSAIGGITDKLLHAGKLAIDKDVNYKDVFLNIKDIHTQLVKELIPVENEAIILAIENKLEKLNSLLEGLYLLNELTPKISDKLVSFGELISSL